MKEYGLYLIIAYGVVFIGLIALIQYRLTSFRRYKQNILNALSVQNER